MYSVNKSEKNLIFVVSFCTDVHCNIKAQTFHTYEKY